MEQYINEFITYLQEIKQSSNNTVQAYRADLKKLQTFLINQDINSLNRIKETSLNTYILALEKEGLSPSSVSRNIASMKAFFLFLIKKGVISGDPTERIKPPKLRKKVPQTIEIALIDQLMLQPNVNSNKGIRDKAMLELLYASGMKVSELLSLKISDLNLKGSFITCGEKKERTIPIGKTALEAIKKYLTIRTEAFDKDGMELLFLNTNGQRLSRQGFWKILKSYAKEAGLDEVMPNTIRHSFASHLIENGADLGSVQEFLGHSDISTTQNYLIHSKRNRREVYVNAHPRA